MRLRVSAVIATITAVVLVAPVAATAAPGASGEHAVTYYVSLGDSLAAGYQPPDMLFTDEGYADQLYAALREESPKLKHVKLGCPGETTETMASGALAIAGRGAKNPCNYPHGSQLAEAVNFLHAHRKFVSLVTIDLGANDVTACLDGAEFDLVCLFGPEFPAVIGGAIGEMQANLTAILGELRAAVGPGVPIVGMNLYNPFLAAWFTDPGMANLSNVLLTDFVNPTLEGVYTLVADGFADVETAFFTTIWTPIPTPSGPVPTNVATICVWTWMCMLGDTHPNADGHGAIADAFEAALP